MSETKEGQAELGGLVCLWEADRCSLASVNLCAKCCPPYPEMCLLRSEDCSHIYASPVLRLGNLSSWKRQMVTGSEELMSLYTKKTIQKESPITARFNSLFVVLWGRSHRHGPSSGVLR